MKEYPEDFPNDIWLAVILGAIAVAIIVCVHYATRMTPEREAALKADGAAAFDAKVEAAGGWDRWLAGEISAGNVSAAPRGAMEVR